MKVFVLDNYDSFTYNLVQYLGELGCELEVRRNDQVTPDQVRDMSPERIVISPGPGIPSKAGISIPLIQEFREEIPILGVCLGHQAIGEAFGGRVIRAPELMHGKASAIHHQGDSIFAGIENPFEATRYHSLIVSEEGLPSCLIVNARSDNGLIMGMRHADYDIFGVQFHPESVLTRPGRKILENFLCCRN